MNKKDTIRSWAYCCCISSLICWCTLLAAQDRVLVWSDEFTGNTIDDSKWAFGTGATNDNVHYYTSRSENINIVDNVLHIIALKESYNGFNYTSALIKTKISWRYGRIEARIKLPATNGFVPAFWMLPGDDIYGWWPNSGEIDIMEHPTNQVSTIYGTVHTEEYNLFTGVNPPQGSNIEIPDAETEFHIYAAEWTENQVDFYVDDQLYFSFINDHNGSATWPFDRSFYIILNLAVGGGWVGDPNETTVFPAIMEVDYVRVYQDLENTAISGDDFVKYSSQEISYIAPGIDGAYFEWEVPGNATISDGQFTNQIHVDWNYFGGDIKAYIVTGEESKILNYPVKVSENLLKNAGFEKGVKYWNKIVGYPGEADFSRITEDVPEGSYALCINVLTLGSNIWDIQLSQKELMLTSGKLYKLSFRAKSDNANGEINLAIINPGNYYVYYDENIELTDTWTLYEFNYTATETVLANINIDLGIQTGVYYLDNFLFTTPELSDMNQIKNGDFFDGNIYWNFNTLSQAQAEGSVANGEYVASITEGGATEWDIHLGQTGISMEYGEKYFIAFDAYAADSRTISSITGKNSEPWTVYSGSQVFNLTTEKQRYNYSFIMNNPTDKQSRFGFDIGNSDIDVFFDNIWVSSGVTTGTAIPELPENRGQIRLFQNYPNPFYSATTVSYYLDKPGHVKIIIYDMLGNEVLELLNEEQITGSHFVTWDGKNKIDQHVNSGLYYYRLVTDDARESRKMLLLK
jgi:beta-glucanase (GH16 family)